MTVRWLLLCFIPTNLTLHTNLFFRPPKPETHKKKENFGEMLQSSQVDILQSNHSTSPLTASYWYLCITRKAPSHLKKINQS